MPESSLLHLQHCKRLLELEYAYEKEQFRQQTETVGIYHKIRQGYCWFPLVIGQSYYNSLNQFVIEVRRTEWTDVEHNFEPGKTVCFFTMDASGAQKSQYAEGQLHYLNFSATVSFVDENRMVIILPGTDSLSQLLQAERLGIQLYLDETTYKLMFEALDHATTAKHGRLAELREILLGQVTAGTYQFMPVRFPWLNTSQETAVNNVLRAKDVAIVHGPPGTGKTTTLVEAIYETLRRESQVLVCAQSNMAVDWIAEKLTDRGVSVMRIGNPSRVNDKMLGFTYERMFESHSLYPQLWAVRKAIRDLYSQRNKGNHNSFHQKITRLRDRATEMELAINADLFSQARVIACTLAGSANRVLTGMSFTTLFIDEAAQALEAACWIAIQKAGRVILAGDHCQLPPTIKSQEALKQGLDRTLMEIIAEHKPQTVSLLKIQYRMNEAIMRFSSHWFYDDKVESAAEVKYRGILDWDSPMVWIDTSDERQTAPYTGDLKTSDNEICLQFEENRQTDTQSKTNAEEAQLTVGILKNYFGRIGKERILNERIDTGIISPYKAQVQMLRHLIRKDPFFKPYRQMISINTVDGFQGQERDIILISMVRSNDEGQIGFLRDLRRMNVAITRARMKLIVIGNSQTLCRNRFYDSLKKYIEQINME